MDIRVLRYFLAVAREQSFSQAAERLYLSQPTLSRQLKELEDELGKQLFVRGNKGVTLTEEGMMLRKRAEEIIELVDKTEEEVRAAGRRFLELGVSQVFITLGEDGVYFLEEGDEGFIRPGDDMIIRSATGAGDSFSACILLGISMGMRAETIARMGMAAAKITMESTNAVNKELSMELIKKLMNKEIEK